MIEWTTSFEVRVSPETGWPPAISLTRDEIGKEHEAVQKESCSPDSLLASFVYSSGPRPGLTLITGPRGTGKTQWCIKLFNHASDIGFRVGGLISPSVFENGKKVGIQLVDLSTGEYRPLAYQRGSTQGDLLTTDWQMDAKTLEWGNSILEKKLDCDLFILDELGPLEFNHAVGLVEGLEIVKSRRDLPVFVSIRPSLIPEARARWYWAQTLKIPPQEVT